jgi:DNA ligase-1
MMIKKPMLAATLENVDALKYPVLCTPKLDGIRCLVVNGKAVTRTFKPFPNNWINHEVGKLPDGLDGEIVVSGKSFSEVTHDVMREDGIPAFTYAVFDYLHVDDTLPYDDRMDMLKQLQLPAFVEKIMPIEVNSKEELLAFEKGCLEAGYEGVMIRAPDGPYKFGRSTVREGFLLKFKRFVDSEAEILELQEQMTNENTAEKDAFGRTKRGSSAEGLVPAGTLGAIKVKDLVSGVEFSIGSGFDAATRAQIWKARKSYIGKTVKYKSQPSGAKDAPRFPVFLGFRDARDM